MVYIRRRVSNINLKKFFLYLLITSVGASALIGIGVILFGNFGELEVKVLLTTLTVTVTSILGLACGAYLESGRSKPMPVTGIVCAIVSAIMWIVVVWHTGQPIEWFMKTVATVTLLAVSCSHLSLLSLARLEKKFIWSRYAVYIVVVCLTAFLLFLIWNERKLDEELVGRVVGVLSILVASLTVITPIFHKLSHGEPDVAEIDAEIAVLRAKIEELEARKASFVPMSEDEIS
jgi:hypothetical protein